MNVLPDIQFSPVGQGEYPNRFAFINFAVVDIPQFWTLIFGVPAMVLVAERINALFSARLFFVTTGATKCGVKLIFV